MPSFKPKTNKKIVINQKNITTLDSKHEEILHGLNEDEGSLPDLKQQIFALEEELDDDDTPLDRKLDIGDEIKLLKIQVKRIKKELMKFL